MLLLLLSLRLSTGEEQEPHTLYLLTLVPYPDPRPSAGWDRGLELLPAAQLACDHINNRTDLLPGYRLELIEANSDACGVSTISTAIINFAKYATSPADRNSVLAVIGLACSSVTAAISPVAGHNQLDYIQVSMSNSIMLRSREKYQHLWRVLPSSVAYADTGIALLKTFNWTNIATVFDGSGVFFYSTALSFLDRARQLGKTSLVESAIEGTSDLYIDAMLASIQQNSVRIIYLSVSEAQSSVILCKAAELGLIWPDYVWIFSARSNVKEFLLDLPCQKEQLLKALENALLFHFQLQQLDPDTVLVSNNTYSEYYEQYLDMLGEYIDYNDTFVPTLFSNPMYDEVFSLALALNSSLPLIDAQNLSLKNLLYNRTAITDIIESQFTNVSFQGATGPISFDENREGQSPVVLYQVRNSSAVIIGEYNSATSKLTLRNINISSFPDDQIDSKYETTPVWILALVFSASGLTTLLTTVVLLLVLCHTQSKVIKAISPILSVVIFIGCYMESLAAIFRTVLFAYSIPPLFYSIMCCLEIWLGSTGLNLILTTVLLKLARIYRIFTYFGKTGKIWSDVSLLLITLMICLPVNLYLILWFSIETPQRRLTEDRNTITTNTTAGSVRLTIVTKTTMCYSENFNVWLTILFMPSILLLIAVIFFAVLTRKINRANFKDTKKITAYVAVIFLTIVVSLPSWKLLEAAGKDGLAHIAISMGFILVAFLTVTFLFVPKVAVILYTEFKDRTSYNISDKMKSSSIKF